MSAKRALLLALVIVASLTVVAVVYWDALMQGLGIEPRTPTSSTYNFWSGSGSVFVPSLITLTGLVLLLWWHHTCHEVDCLRYGRFTTDEADGQKVLRCKKHHLARHE